MKKNMGNKLPLIALIFTFSLLTGCGFTLRGAAELPTELQTMALTSPGGNSDILREVRRSLQASDITLLDSPSLTNYTLVIGNESSEERVLSVNDNARAGEYELIVSVPFQLRLGTDVIAGPETLSVEKVYLADPNSAVAKREERELLEEEMRRELVNQLMRRLQAISL